MSIIYWAAWTLSAYIVGLLVCGLCVAGAVMRSLRGMRSDPTLAQHMPMVNLSDRKMLGAMLLMGLWMARYWPLRTPSFLWNQLARLWRPKQPSAVEDMRECLPQILAESRELAQKQQQAT